MKHILFILSFFVCAEVFAQDLSAYQKEIFHGLPYRILYPSPFDSLKKYPLVVFLHGAYHKGSDNEAQLEIGGRYFMRTENSRDYPAVVVFPQCPVDDLWAYFTTGLDSVTGLASAWQFPFRREPTAVTGLLKALLDSLRTVPYCDSTRSYLGGLSQGGMGVFDMVARYPGYFAAAFPICGAGNVSTSKKIAGRTALWIFHGRDDEIVPPRFSRLFYKRIKKEKGEVRYSEYPGVHHNSWINAFAEKELLSWLFSHHTPEIPVIDP
jgi:predicted peptidase